LKGLHTGLHADIYALLPIQEEHSSPDGVSCEALHVQQRLVAIQLHGCNDWGCARMLGTQLVLKPQPPVTIIRLAIHPTQLQSRQPWQYIEGGQWDGTLPWRGSRLLLHTSCVLANLLVPQAVRRPRYQPPCRKYGGATLSLARNAPVTLAVEPLCSVECEMPTIPLLRKLFSQPGPHVFEAEGAGVHSISRQRRHVCNCDAYLFRAPMPCLNIVLLALRNVLAKRVRTVEDQLVWVKARIM